MHISLVPRHKVGENIFLPKRCVPFCEFFLVSVWYAYVHLYWIKEIGMKDSHAFLPCLMDCQCSHPAAAPSPRYSLCGVLYFTCGLCLPFFPVPSPSAQTVVPGTPLPLGPAEVASSCPASGVSAAGAAQPRLCSWKSALELTHCCSFPVVVEKLLFFFF